MEVKLQALFALELDGSEWSASGSSHLFPGKESLVLVTDQVGLVSQRQATFNVMNLKLAISFREVFHSVYNRVRTENFGPGRKKE
jgi:hypothetical protein